LRGKDSAERLSRRRLRRAFYLVMLAVLIGLLVSYWSWVDAQVRAAVVISSVLEAPILTPGVEVVSGEPGFEDVSVAGNPALVARPAGEGPWPAIFLVNGTVAKGRKLPEVRNLAEGFARAGYIVVVPDLPGLTEDEITPETARETVDVAREVSERPDVEGGEVALVGVSTGATLALVAAEDPALRGKVSLVAGVAPYSNIKTVLNIATTGHYHRPGGEPVRYEADPFLSYVVARSLVAVLPSGEDRLALSAERMTSDRTLGASSGCSQTVIRNASLRSTPISPKMYATTSKSSRRSPALDGYVSQSSSPPVPATSSSPPHNRTDLSASRPSAG
jgi:pimeloyl-ACP methyl ester carboxylesterase